MNRNFVFIISLIVIISISGCIMEGNNIANGKFAVIQMKSFGEIKIEFSDKAPITVENFVMLAEAGKFDGTQFHRIINDFMIQGGDFTKGDGTGGHAARYHEGFGNPDIPETWLIPDEFHDDLKNEYGAISMANKGPNTGGSQFFIIDKKDGTPWLDGKHAVFGKVVSGMDIIEKISEVDTDSSDKPFRAVIIEKVTITDK
ncbi:MAG: peptidylprolyl isomerase [Candidatus Aenigmarchaeota archaeon]|nr:peptidylprolyl isomerase [Candidatus Aenigmarchaeota archaeon]